jgi:hypothetical protein
MAGDLTCTHAGSLHPFSRTLDLWAFSPTGTNSLRVEDADISGEGLPAGRWVHLSLPAEQLHEHPRSWLNGGPDDPEPVLITRLQFRAATPLWLDEIRLLGLVPDIPTAVGEATPPSRPRDSVLLPAYPNPFNAGTVIPFRLRRPGLTRLVLLDILGQRVRSLVNADLPAGDHSIAWDGRDDSGSALGTGVYLARLTVGTDVILFDKIMLVR